MSTGKFLQTNFKQKKWFLIFSNFQQTLPELGQRVWQHCPSCIWGVQATFVRKLFFNHIFFQLFPDFECKKMGLLAENIRKVCSKLHFMCTEEIFEETLFFSRLILFLFNNSSHFESKIFRKLAKNRFVEDPFHLSRRSFWGSCFFLMSWISNFFRIDTQIFDSVQCAQENF